MRLVILASVLAVCIASPAVAGKEFSSDGWEGRLFRNEKTRELESCMVSTKNSAGNSLDFLVFMNPKIGSGVLDFFISATNSSWQLTAGRTYSSRIWIDEGLLGLGGVSVGKFGTATARISYSTRTFRKLKQGDELKFRVDKKNIFFPLNGSAKAVSWLETCAKQGIADAMRSRKDSPAPLAETGKLTLNNMSGILNEAGLTGYVLAPGEQANRQIGDKWQWGRGGGMQLYEKKAGKSFDVVFANAVERFKRTCIEISSSFRNVVGTFENGTAYGRSTFNCVDDQGKLSYAMIAIDDGDDVMVIIQFSEISKDANEAHSRVVSVLEEMFR